MPVEPVTTISGDFLYEAHRLGLKRPQDHPLWETLNADAKAIWEEYAQSLSMEKAKILTDAVLIYRLPTYGTHDHYVLLERANTPPKPDYLRITQETVNNE